MRTAAVIIDKWKLAIFTRHLREAGFSYETAAGVTDDTHTLRVQYDAMGKLEPVIQAAQQSCAKARPGTEK